MSVRVFEAAIYSDLVRHFYMIFGFFFSSSYIAKAFGFNRESLLNIKTLTTWKKITYFYLVFELFLFSTCIWDNLCYRNSDDTVHIIHH